MHHMHTSNYLFDIISIKRQLELNLRKKYDINVVAISENGKVSVTIDPYRPLGASERLVAIANTDKLSKMTR